MTEEQIKRKLLWMPCQSKQDLHRWIKIYLGLDMPDGTVDPASNSSPMDVIWETYRAALDGREDFTQALAYSSRDSFKTLGAAVIELLMIVHCERSAAHMAAIESQAKKSQQYLKKFLNRPLLRDYVTSKNERTLEVTRYRLLKDAATVLTPSEWGALTQAQKDQYEEVKNYISIVICTIAGANSEHVPFMCVDELDVISNPDAYEESKFIPTITNGKPPITFLTSTRKYSFGIVQKEIDKANESGLQIRHWNIIDVTERCHPDRHLPDEERVDIYYSEDLLRSVSKPEWELMSPDQQARFVKGEGYAGCLKNCRLFAVCKGRLADRTERPYSDAKYNTDKRIMLKTIPHVITQFRKSSNEKAKAQLMCWKPSKEGLIYPSFDRDVHSLTPAQMAHKITGEHYSPHLTKAQLVDIMQQRQLRFVAGQDYGFTHNFATVTAAVQGAHCYVFDVISAPELELHQKIEICEAKLKRFNPEIWADVAYPSDIKSFKRAGFRMRDWAKAKDSVTGGIESVRSKLSPTMGEPQLFFLRDDDGCELLMRRISEYHWKLDAANKPTDIPDDTDDDECDALRYLVMNVFSPKPQVAAPTEESVAQKSNWMSDQIKTLVGEESFDTGGSKGRSGGFVWDL